MNLDSDTFKPFTKPNTVPLYINCQSNHPPCVLKNIPAAINKRLSKISCNEAVFNAATPAYQEALNKSGYKHVLKFDPEARTPTTRSKNRKRRISWFNPPFNINTKTNLGAKLLKLIDKSFPVGHPLRKICNRNTIKLSYRCTPNIGSVISTRNARLLADPPAPEEKTCSCPKNKECPLDKKCLSKNIVYKATITQENQKTETYTGLTSTTFKARLGTHKTSFKNPEANQTSLSRHINKLKKKNITHSIKWEKVSSAEPFSPYVPCVGCPINTCNALNFCAEQELLCIYISEQIKTKLESFDNFSGTGRKLKCEAIL